MARQIAGPSPAELGRHGAAAALHLHHGLAQLRGARHEAGDLLDGVLGGACRAGPGGQRDHGLRAQRPPGAAKLRAQRTPASELSTSMISSTHEDVASAWEWAATSRVKASAAPRWWTGAGNRRDRARWARESSVWRVAAMARLFKMKRDASTTFVVLALLCWQCARARWPGLGSRGADGPSNAGYARV